MLQWEETKKFIADTAIYNISTAGQDKDSSQRRITSQLKEELKAKVVSFKQLIASRGRNKESTMSLILYMVDKLLDFEQEQQAVNKLLELLNILMD